MPASDHGSVVVTLHDGRTTAGIADGKCRASRGEGHFTSWQKGRGRLREQGTYLAGATRESLSGDGCFCQHHRLRRTRYRDTTPRRCVSGNDSRRKC